jgi:hypothetical protein
MQTDDLNPQQTEMMFIFPVLTTSETLSLFLAKSPLSYPGDISVGGEVYGNVRGKSEVPNCGLRSSGRF